MKIAAKPTNRNVQRYALALGIIAPLLGGTLLCQEQPALNPKQILSFVSASSNEFTFDTGVLRGRLQAKGRSMGLSSVIYLPTGTRLDASMGLLSHYRVFSANKRYGTAAWDWPSEATLRADGSVGVHWASSAERPIELWASYRWASPDTLDVETRVDAKMNLSRFESFVASYWSPPFTNSLVYVRELPGRAGQSGLMAAEKSSGQWQAFPRDDLAVQIIRDGRWKLEPNPVDWVILPSLAQPLGVRRAPAIGLTAILMSPPTDCFAISTPHQDDAHYSMYVSLFGCDLKSGETARARMRLVITSNLAEAEIVKAYKAYRKESIKHVP